MLKRVIYQAFSCLMFLLIYQQAQCQFTSQAIPIHGQYMLHPYTWNPAYAGHWRSPDFGVTYKGPFPDFGETRDMTIYMNGNFNQYKSGIGLLFQDTRFKRLGINFIQYRIAGSYRFKANFTENTRMLIGVNAGLVHYVNNTPPPSSINGQPIPQLVNERHFYPTYDLGFLLEFKKAYLAGALHHMNEPSFQFWSPGPVYDFRQEVFIALGFDWTYQDQMTFTPEVMIQQEERRTLMQVSLTANYRDIVFMTFGTRNTLDTLNYNGNDRARFDTDNLLVTVGTTINQQYLAAFSYKPKLNGITTPHYEFSLGYSIYPRRRETVGTATSFRSPSF